MAARTSSCALIALWLALVFVSVCLLANLIPQSCFLRHHPTKYQPVANGTTHLELHQNVEAPAKMLDTWTSYSPSLNGSTSWDVSFNETSFAAQQYDNQAPATTVCLDCFSRRVAENVIRCYKFNEADPNPEAPAVECENVCIPVHNPEQMLVGMPCYNSKAAKKKGLVLPPWAADFQSRQKWPQAPCFGGCAACGACDCENQFERKNLDAIRKAEQRILYALENDEEADGTPDLKQIMVVRREDLLEAVQQYDIQKINHYQSFYYDDGRPIDDNELAIEYFKELREKDETEWQYYDNGMPVLNNQAEAKTAEEIAEEAIDFSEIVMNTAEMGHHGIEIVAHAGKELGKKLADNAHAIGHHLHIIPVMGLIVGSVGIGFTAYEMFHVNNRIKEKMSGGREYELVRAEFMQEFAGCDSETERRQTLERLFQKSREEKNDIDALNTNLTYGKKKLLIGAAGMGLATAGIIMGTSAPLWLPFAGVAIGTAAMYAGIKQKMHRKNNAKLWGEALAEMHGLVTNDDHIHLVNWTGKESKIENASREDFRTISET